VISGQDIQQAFFHPLGCIENGAIGLKGMLGGFQAHNILGLHRTDRDLLRRDFDLPTIGRFVLGRYWRRASEAEPIEFVLLFEDYLVAIYGRRLGNYGSAGLTVTGHRADGNDDAIVYSKIESYNAPVILLDWRLKLREGGWRVVDIMVEGVSLAMAQRSEFTSVIGGSGGKVSGLLAKLRKKTQTVALNNDAAAPAGNTDRTQ